jgi:hypothetical protein
MSRGVESNAADYGRAYHTFGNGNRQPRPSEKNSLDERLNAEIRAEVEHRRYE